MDLFSIGFQPWRVDEFFSTTETQGASSLYGARGGFVNQIEKSYHFGSFYAILEKLRTLEWSTCARYIQRNASAATPLREWFHLCEKADWSNFAEVRSTFNAADQLGDRLIFNIGGNNYRLIASIDYPKRFLAIRWIGTHAEYDRLTQKEIREL